MKNDAGKCGLKRPPFHIIYSIESIHSIVGRQGRRWHNHNQRHAIITTTIQAMSKFETLLENFNDKINFNNI